MAGTGIRRFAGGLRGAGSARPGLFWSPSLRVSGVSSVSGPGRFSVFLIVVALLFCHGAFGYAHQVSPVDITVEKGAHSAHAVHDTGVHQVGQNGNTEGTHLGDAYFATLMLLLFGAALLVGGGAPAGKRLAIPGPRMDRGVWRLYPPRGPTTPRLQVFRL